MCIIRAYYVLRFFPRYLLRRNTSRRLFIVTFITCRSEIVNKNIKYALQHLKRATVRVPVSPLCIAIDKREGIQNRFFVSTRIRPTASAALSTSRLLSIVFRRES